MALKGLRVIEMAGLAPAPFCGMILADFGAQVIRVDKVSDESTRDTLARGKLSVAVNMKKQEGVDTLMRMCDQADVLIEPFRAGVMEKLGLGPDVLMKNNPRLIYARLTGFGQTGCMAKRAGHDVNYLAMSGILSLLGRKDQKPHFPLNLLADFAGGGLMCALGVVMALYERSVSGMGQVIDANMVEGVSYLSSFVWRTLNSGFIWPNPGERGNNLLDGGVPFYDTYETADGKFMAVGALEPQFYNLLLKGLNLTHEEAPQIGNFDDIREKFQRAFKTKAQAEWCKVFDSVDACVAPVLSLDEAVKHPHNVVSDSFMTDQNGEIHAKPAPRLQRSPGVSTVQPQPEPGQHTVDVLRGFGFSMKEIKDLEVAGVVRQSKPSSHL